jgi:VCBS repeat-containing protein
LSKGDFGYGYGHDTIDSYGGGLDRVYLEHGITPDDVTLVRRGSDVIIGLGGDDRMVLLGWFVQPTNRVQEIMFCDAPAWDEATIAALANANLNAVIAVNDFAQVFEDAPDSASGNVLDNDAPAGSTLTVVDPRVEVASFGILQLAADGSFTFAVDNTQPTVQWLAVGEHLFESFSYIAADGAGGYDEATLFIDIAGTNDAPVLDSGAQAELVEDLSALEYFAGPQRLENGGFESGLDGWTLDGNIQHVGWNSLSASGFSSAFFGAIGEPTLLTQDVETAAGERYLLGFTLWGGADAGAAFSVIWNGETVLTVNEADPDSGDYDYEVIVEGIDGISQLTLAGRNDPGFWHLDDVRLGLLDAIALDESEASGTILFTDPDYSDSHVLTVEPRDAGYLGEFDAYIDWDSAFNWEGQVAWEFFVPNEDLQFLAEGETREQVYDLVLEDDFGGSDTKSVTITLRGVNDAPEIEDDAAEVSEDGVLTASGNVLDNDFDIDALDVLSVANPGSLVGQYGTLDLAADGRFTYTRDNDSEAVQALNAGEQVEDVFEYGVTDGLAIELPQFFVTITGANDAPIAADDAADVQEDGVQVAAGQRMDCCHGLRPARSQ